MHTVHVLNLRPGDTIAGPTGTSITYTVTEVPALVAGEVWVPVTRETGAVNRLTYRPDTIIDVTR